MHEIDNQSLTSWTVFNDNSDVDKVEQMFVRTFCHKDSEDMDRTEDDDKLDETVDEPLEQGDNKEDKDTPETLT